VFHGLLTGLGNEIASSNSESNMELASLLYLLAHSIAIGVSLSVMTFFGTRTIYGKKETNTESEIFQLMLGSFNLLLLCVGLTGVMILISNSIVRAFAIVAALALVRFRVKLDQKSLSASVLFAVLGGMSCGLTEVKLGWLMTAVYALISLALIVLMKLFGIRAPSSQQKISPSAAPAAPLRAQNGPPVV